MSEQESIGIDRQPITTFEFLEFNRVRWMRDKEAAKISVIENGVTRGFLWMSVENIRDNIRDFGPSEQLNKALKAYGELP